MTGRKPWFCITRDPDRVPCPEITEEEVMEAIRMSAGNKAPGPDQTPNKVLKVDTTLPATLQALDDSSNTEARKALI
ncbi:hypothetical protein KCU67_g15, partial [Aureobasidium melanogenum]